MCGRGAGGRGGPRRPRRSSAYRGIASSTSSAADGNAPSENPTSTDSSDPSRKPSMASPARAIRLATATTIRGLSGAWSESPSPTLPAQ